MYKRTEDEENVQALAIEELKQVFTTELAYLTYLPFLKHIGVNSMDVSLKNHSKIRELCQEWEQEMLTSRQTRARMNMAEFGGVSKSVPTSGSIGSNISVIGKLEVQSYQSLSSNL